MHTARSLLRRGKHAARIRSTGYLQWGSLVRLCHCEFDRVTFVCFFFLSDGKSAWEGRQSEEMDDRRFESLCLSFLTFLISDGFIQSQKESVFLHQRPNLRQITAHHSSSGRPRYSPLPMSLSCWMSPCAAGSYQHVREKVRQISSPVARCVPRNFYSIPQRLDVQVCGECKHLILCIPFCLCTRNDCFCTRILRCDGVRNREDDASCC